jgi:hypothetical protein
LQPTVDAMLQNVPRGEVEISPSGLHGYGITAARFGTSCAEKLFVRFSALARNPRQTANENDDEDEFILCVPSGKVPSASV